MRLDKYVAELTNKSRSEVKSAIKNGMATVNGVIAKKPEEAVTEGKDRICFKGQELLYEPFVYYMLHKPAGVVSATQDNLSKTVLDLLETTHRKDLFPVGRLDKDTEGLLLLTNDGNFAHNLLSPKKKVAKVYLACVSGKVGESEILAMASGLSIGEEKDTLPAKLELIWQRKTNQAPFWESQIKLTITEGRFHQVKRMFHALGMEVLSLKRIAMGEYILDETLLPGDYKQLKR